MTIKRWEQHPEFITSPIINFDYSVITLQNAVVIKPGAVSIHIYISMRMLCMCQIIYRVSKLFNFKIILITKCLIVKYFKAVATL